MPKGKSGGDAGKAGSSKGDKPKGGGDKPTGSKGEGKTGGGSKGDGPKGHDRPDRGTDKGDRDKGKKDSSKKETPKADVDKSRSQRGSEKQAGRSSSGGGEARARSGGSQQREAGHKSSGAASSGQRTAGAGRAKGQGEKAVRQGDQRSNQVSAAVKEALNAAKASAAKGKSTNTKEIEKTISDRLSTGGSKVDVKVAGLGKEFVVVTKEGRTTTVTRGVIGDNNSIHCETTAHDSESGKIIGHAEDDGFAREATRLKEQIGAPRSLNPHPEFPVGDDPSGTGLLIEAAPSQSDERKSPSRRPEKKSTPQEKAPSPRPRAEKSLSTSDSRKPRIQKEPRDRPESRSDARREQSSSLLGVPPPPLPPTSKYTLDPVEGRRWSFGAVDSKGNWHLWAPDLPPGESYETNSEWAKGTPGWTDPSTFKEFIRRVKTKGPYDYKQLSRSYETAGNFNFGVIAHDLGIPLEVAKAGAGAWQVKTGTAKADWVLTNFDDPRDQAAIEAGYEYAEHEERRRKRELQQNEIQEMHLPSQGD